MTQTKLNDESSVTIKMSPCIAVKKKTEEKSDGNDVLKLIRPIHFLLRVFLPIPYDITGIANNSIRLGHVKLSTCIYSLISVAVIILKEYTEHENSLDYVETQINFVTYDILLITTYLNRTKITDILNKMVRLDAEMIKAKATMAVSKKVQWEKRIFYAICMLMILFVFIETIVSLSNALFFSHDRPLLNKLHNFTYAYIKITEAVYFAYITVNILISNVALSCLCEFIKETIDLKMTTDARSAQIATNRKLYVDTWHIVRHINYNYNLPITVICLVSFVNSITTFYDWWLNCNKEQYDVMSAIPSLIFHVMPMLTLILICDKAKQRGKEIRELLYNFWVNSSNYWERLMIFQFLIQTTHEGIEYYACDMFPLDRSLIASVVVAVTTYSILLVQLGD